MRGSPRTACRLTAGVIAAVGLVLLAACADGNTTPTSGAKPDGDGAAPPSSGGAPPLPTGPFVVGSTYLDPDGYIEYQPGAAPLVIIAPHGGALLPAGLPDRACAACVTVTDGNTQELARLIVDSFAVRTGRRPHLVVNRLNRRKFDANREIVEATSGNAALERTWLWLHAVIDTAKATVVRTTAQGLVIDLHGHGHAIPRLELGYLIPASTLRLDDAALVAGSSTTQSSIAQVARSSVAGDAPIAVLNGPNSLGGMLATAGIPAVPSHLDRAPVAGDEYFNGGYNTARHGSQQGGVVDAIQIESHNTGIRDIAANRERFAGMLATALARYLDRHYGWR